MTRLFVYGTLRNGGSNYDLLDGHTLSEETAFADHLGLYANRSDTFPYAQPAPGNSVTGTLCTIHEDLWPALQTRLDLLEGYHPSNPDHNHYVRVLWPVRRPNGPGASAWLYLASNRIRLDPQRLVASGDWFQR